jgi:hypothetical protein
MPNGGPDNCGRCGFNRANSGVWPGPGEENLAPGFCSIRGFEIANPLWTYCKNQHTREGVPFGPIYTAVYINGYQRVPCFYGYIPTDGSGECMVCGDHADFGIGLTIGENTLRFCGCEHYLIWWTDELKGRLEGFKKAGEKAYDDMYEARSSSDATALYSDAKESFYGAIAAAKQLEWTDEAAALEKRLHHIKDVFRSQFT